MNGIQWTDELESKLCSPEEIEENNREVETMIPHLLTMEEAKALQPSDVLWMEQIGGHEGSHYGVEQCAVRDTNDDHIKCVCEKGGNTYSASRAWSGYNKRIGGWRLWSSEPKYEQWIAEPWEAVY